MTKKFGLLIIIMVLLIACRNPNLPQSISAAKDEAQSIYKQHNREASENVMVSQETNYLTETTQVMQLTEEEIECIQILVSACIHASSGSSEEHLVDQKMLESDDMETEFMMQTVFILSIYNNDYAAEANKRLANVAEMINEDEMILTHNQLYALLEMAGAKPLEELKYYHYLKQWYMDGYYRIPKYHAVGEIFPKIDFVNIEKKEDGEVLVNAILRLEYDYGPIKAFKVTLLPNRASIFQYSVKSVRAELIQPNAAGKIGTDIILQKPYVTPDYMSQYPFDYIFELEGALYQMPFPAGELEQNGWNIEEQGHLEAGGRKKVHATNVDSVLTIGLWNYNTDSSDLKDCQVVWLKTGRDKAWNAVNFKLAEGVQTGKNKTEVKPLYLDFLNEHYTSYGRSDALYRDVYGYKLYFENEVIKGFEMGYAPTQADRQNRIQMMTESWEQDPINKMDLGKDFEMELDNVYQVDIDGDGYDEEIRVKRLSGIQWADYLCVFLNGEINYVVRGLSTDQLHCDTMQMVVENGQHFFVFQGEEYAAGIEIHRKIRIEKGWSKEVEYSL